MTNGFATCSPLSAHERSRPQLRQALRQLRRTLPQRELREHALDAALERELMRLRGGIVGAYCASRDEYDALRVLVRVGERLGWPWAIALPVVQPDTRAMRFCAWRPGDALRAGAYGIHEPEDCGREVEPQVLLVPCVGFAADGLRLGYGGGYYDRYLEHRPQVRTIGLAFEACRIEGLEAQAHDRPLDVVLTECARYARSHED